METYLPDTMERWCPVVCLAALWLGAAVFKVKAVQLRSVNLPKAEANAKFAYGLAVWAPRAFLPLATGAVLGQATAQDAFRPRANLWGLGSMVGTLALYARLTVWLHWQAGADFVVEHADLVGRRIESPLMVKLALSLMMAGGLTAMAMAWLRER